LAWTTGALPQRTQLAEIHRSATRGRQQGMHLTFPDHTKTAGTFRVTAPAADADTPANTATETTQVG